MLPRGGRRVDPGPLEVPKLVPPASLDARLKCLSPTVEPRWPPIQELQECLDEDPDQRNVAGLDVNVVVVAPEVAEFAHEMRLVGQRLRDRLAVLAGELVQPWSQVATRDALIGAHGLEEASGPDGEGVGCMEELEHALVSGSDARWQVLERSPRGVEALEPHVVVGPSVNPVVRAERRGGANGAALHQENLLVRRFFYPAAAVNDLSRVL